MIYIGSDHRGFKLKEKLHSWLEDEGYEVADIGAREHDKDDDYPVFAGRLGRSVVKDANGRGVLLCGSGVGAVAAVNKLDGIRGSVGFNKEQVAAGRHDDDMNVLVIAADYINEKKAQELVRVFLETEFDSETERYQRRIDQITELEEKRG